MTDFTESLILFTADRSESCSKAWLETVVEWVAKEIRARSAQEKAND